MRQRWGDSRAKQSLLDMTVTALRNSQHLGSACIRPAPDQANISTQRGSQAPHIWDAMDSWQLLGEEELVFFKSITLVGGSCSSGQTHTPSTQGSTKGTQWVIRKRCIMFIQFRALGEKCLIMFEGRELPVILMRIGWRYWPRMELRTHRKEKETIKHLVLYYLVNLSQNLETLRFGNTPTKAVFTSLHVKLRWSGGATGPQKWIKAQCFTSTDHLPHCWPLNHEIPLLPVCPLPLSDDDAER